MQIVVWIVIILVAVFLIWLLKKWIKRIIFILILLALAFFIYGIFSPSWAAKLWYNVRTFPQRITSWISSGSEFLDYDSYKSKVSSIWDTIWDAIWDEIKSENDDYEIWDSDSDDGFDINIDLESNEEKDTEKQQDTEKIENKNDPKASDENTIRSFPKSIKFVGLPELKKEETKNLWSLSWYSRYDLLWVINKYIEKNLDDDTDILVTVEYEEDSWDPQKIIMQTQSRTGYTISNSNNLMNEIFSWDNHWSDSKDIIVFPEDVEIIPSTKDISESPQKKTQTVQKTTSTKLTQKDQKEAEEVFSILF